MPQTPADLLGEHAQKKDKGENRVLAMRRISSKYAYPFSPTRKFSPGTCRAAKRHW